MALKDGDIITLDYEGRTEGVLFDTTLEKVAKKEDSIVENRVYAPITVVVGDGRLVPGLENVSPWLLCASSSSSENLFLNK